MTKDPYQYFRIEAREVISGLTRGLLEIEKDGTAPERVSVLLRLAHTLKGAARVVKQTEISKHAHDLEEILTRYRGSSSPVQKDDATSMFGHVDAIAALVRQLGSGEPARGAPRLSTEVPSPASAIKDELLESVRIDNSGLDALQKHLHIASIQLAGQLEQLRAVRHPADVPGPLAPENVRGRSVNRRNEAAFAALSSRMIPGSRAHWQDGQSAGLERINAELSEIQKVLTKIRMRPASSIFGLLERAVRDAAQFEAKRVEFKAIGGENRLDAYVLAAMRDVLIHVVRNAVAHGIESEEQRTAAQKPAVGRIEVAVERRGTRIVFRCRDDGKGIDYAAIRKVAAARGLLPASQADALTPEQAIKLVLQGGLSTAASATEVSGRGIGLEFVHSTIARLNGSLDIRSVPNVETCVEMCVPVSLASITALRMEMGGSAICIPLDRVRRAVRLRESDLVRSKDGVFLVVDGQSIPYIRLEDVLKRPGPRVNRKQFSAVILESDVGQAVLGADRLRSTVTVASQKLPEFIAADETVLGAFLNQDGEPELLLDPAAIVRLTRSRSAEGSEAAGVLAHQLLVIDDSLTTRMLEQSILESAGFRVDLAVSAEDGLKKARERSYALFIVDVEMPGMNGFEFVEFVRTQPDLRGIPCILVTSRNSPEDRARGQRAGAQEYIVKSEFNQDFLLQTIRGLLD